MLLYPLAQVQDAIFGHSEQNEGMICSRIVLERNIKLLLQQFLYVYMVNIKQSASKIILNSVRCDTCRIINSEEKSFKSA